MSNRRTTPLTSKKIEGHHCTENVRLEKISLVPFFQHLNEESLKKINRLFSTRHFETDDIIYHQGEKAAFLRIVVFGTLRLIHHTTEGKDILIDLLQPGEYFGTLPVLGDDQYSETAYAHTDCCILSVDQNEFKKILHKYPETAISLIKITTQRLKSARDKIQYLTTSPVKQRIGAVLLDLAKKFGENKPEGTLIQIPLSRKNLADMTGTSPETASRIMSRFQQDKLIKTGRRWVSVINEEALSRLTDR